MLFDQIPLLTIGLHLLWQLHLPLAALVFGGGVVALLCRIYGRVERDRRRTRLSDLLLARLLPGPKGCLLLAGTLALGLWGMATRLPLLPLDLRFGTLVVGALVVGLVLMHLGRYMYRRGFEDPLADLVFALGLLKFLGAYLLLLLGAGLLVTPETWPLVPAQPLLALTWNGCAKLAEFLLLAPALTAVVILLLGADADEPFRLFRQRCALTVGLPALLALAPLLAFDLNTQPLLAWSLPVFLFAALMLLLAAALSLQLLRPVLAARPSACGPMLLLGLLLFPLWVGFASASWAGVLTPYTQNPHLLYQEKPLESRLTLAMSQVPAAKEAAAAPAADLRRGEQVFKSICSACHAWDEQVVGPAYAKVIPAYKGKVEQLKAFIRKPVKKNPDLPVMPNLGLSEADIDAVAHYLLSRVEKP